MATPGFSSGGAAHSRAAPATMKNPATAAAGPIPRFWVVVIERCVDGDCCESRQDRNRKQKWPMTIPAAAPLSSHAAGVWLITAIAAKHPATGRIQTPRLARQ